MCSKIKGEDGRGEGRKLRPLQKLSLQHFGDNSASTFTLDVMNGCIAEPDSVCITDIETGYNEGDVIKTNRNDHRASKIVNACLAHELFQCLWPTEKNSSSRNDFSVEITRI